MKNYMTFVASFCVHRLLDTKLKIYFLIIRILVKCLHINKKNSSKCTLIFLTIYNTDVFLMCQMELISYNEVLRTIIVPANVLI